MNCLTVNSTIKVSWSSFRKPDVIDRDLLPITNRMLLIAHQEGFIKRLKRIQLSILLVFEGKFYSVIERVRGQKVQRRKTATATFSQLLPYFCLGLVHSST